MTWEETIIKIRKENDYKDLVAQAYFEEDLKLNVERFSKSKEYKETQKLIVRYAPNAKSILDIGCGNGISAISFALQGYQVTAVEPDESETVGAGAIKKLKTAYKLDNLDVFEAFAEDINFANNSFDIVYIRQAMHHANNLDKFVAECVRVLKPNGLLLTIRDHVIFNDNDKQCFLKNHPLHKFYGGENAYKPEAYRSAIKNAGAIIKKELKYFDSVINYFPLTDIEIKAIGDTEIKDQKKKLYNKIGALSKIPFVWNLYVILRGYRAPNENKIPGRMYSYIAYKK
ncbi:class I SAM-dependent methyltransferase [Flavivirga algicola]|uniref:Class I SAM-dependent methyltransferase n=1 Tax=Flavivirga algicola TaxID=2729136 RepID=A0ABX1RUH7_9FLAO|nr:class I SAM-dependent methyltransferase [Flavivirga algicola]NMH86358.1 class I SAM-dependent methyltransferase [Flavivirga algicola]